MRILLSCVFVLCLISLVGSSLLSDEARTMNEPSESGNSGKSTTVTIYSVAPDHLWNRLHAAIFVRTIGDRQTTGHDTVDPLLWPNTSHLLAGKSHTTVIRILDEFLDNRGEKQVEEPLAKALLQHDLWAVHDWAAARSKVAPKASAALCDRLSRIIHKLALTPEQIRTLPSNYMQAIKSKKWPGSLDPTEPTRAFLPAKVFDKHASWVCISGREKQPNSVVHLNYFGGRSAFLAFMQLPGGRDATLEYLKGLNQKAKAVEPFTEIGRGDSKEIDGLPELPVGTKVALVRQMMLIDKGGNIVPSPVIQSVRIRVYLDTNKDVGISKQAVIKFKISRARLLAQDGGGITEVGRDEKERIAIGLDREDLSGRFAELHRCASCHGWYSSKKRIGSVFSFNKEFLGSRLPGKHTTSRLYGVAVDAELDRTVQWKKRRADWAQLRRAINALTRPS